MNIAKWIGWAITIFVVIVLFLAALAVLNLGLGILSVIGSLLASAIGLVFSKGFITLAAIGLVAYLLWERAQDRKRRHCYQERI